MHSFMIDVQPLIIAIASALLTVVLYGRYRDVRSRMRVEYTRHQLKRFAKTAQRNGFPEASAAYDNASHVVCLILERGVNVEPELIYTPDAKIEGAEILPVTSSE
jgi:hypothetical protein